MSYMASSFIKSTMAILVLCIATNANAQTSFKQKKIAQRRDQSVAGAWVGIDSALWFYNGNGDSIQKTSVVFGNNTWTPLTNNIFTYNANGLVQDFTRQSWTNNAWLNGSKFSSTYNSNNLEVEYLKQVWNSGTNSWSPDLRLIKTYSTTNKIIQEDYYKYISGNWQALTATNYSYDAQDNVEKEIISDYDGFTGQYIQNTKREYAWSAFGQASVAEYKFDPANNLWWGVTALQSFYNINTGKLFATISKKDSTLKNDIKTEYFYDSATANLSELLISKADTGSLWKLSKQYTFDYNADSTRRSCSYNLLYLSNWQPDSIAAYTYDAQKNLTSILHSVRNNNMMNDAHVTSYKYDANNNNTYYLYQDKFGSSLSNVAQTFFYYNRYPLELSNQFRVSNISVYPNPANDLLNVQLQNKFDAQLMVCNLQGQLLQQTYITPDNDLNVKLPIQHLHSGQYVLQILQNGQVQTVSFLKQ
jgi:Secretion system C-terminal sorting domain